jgi:hypothetical protein
MGDHTWLACQETGLAVVEDLNRVKGNAQSLLDKLTTTENVSATASASGSFDVSFSMMLFDR